MSDKPMNAMMEKKTTWWSEPMVWMLIALPVSAVVGGALTIWLATKNADTLVKEEHVKDWLTVNQVLDRDRRAAELGIEGDLDIAPGRLVLDLRGRLESFPASLALTLGHPSDPAQDLVLLMSAERDGRYVANFAELPPGKRHVELAPADGAWRITGQILFPHTGPLRLAAPAQLTQQSQPSLD